MCKGHPNVITLTKSLSRLCRCKATEDRDLDRHRDHHHHHQRLQIILIATPLLIMIATSVHLIMIAAMVRHPLHAYARARARVPARQVLHLALITVSTTAIIVDHHPDRHAAGDSQHVYQTFPDLSETLDLEM
eukprot:g30875.t1